MFVFSHKEGSVPDKFRIAFISGKLGDVDGVSLEVDKWIDVLLHLGHEVYTIAGFYAQPVSRVPRDKQILLEKIRFNSPEQNYYENLVFPFLSKRPPHISEERRSQILKELYEEGTEVANQLFEIVDANSIDVLIAQNTNAMPMTLLGGMGVYQLIEQKRVATIFHHHDFWWERSRFSHNYIEDLLNQTMPPTDPGTEHVVISSYAAHILRSIKRVNPHVVPNCEDFETAPVPDDYNSHFRRDLGFAEDDILIVQPTRIVPRKRIEDSVELVARFIEKYPELEEKIQFIISLYQGDELDNSYVDDIKGLAKRRRVPLRLIAERVSSQRGEDSEGRRLYTNRDVLVNADMVTYLPVWEGFGNALLEAIAARKPVVTTTYLVYKTDIKASGFKNIEIRDQYDQYHRLLIPEEPLAQMHKLLFDEKARQKMVDHNFKVGKREFSLKTLEKKLANLIDVYSDEIRASRRRLRKNTESYYV